MAGDHRDGSPRGFAPRVDRTLGLPHYLLAGGATLLSLGLSALFHLGGTGPQGAPGTTTVITKTGQAGVCAYFGPDSSGRTRFQLSVPYQDAAGLYCNKGELISVNPIRK